MDDENMTEEGGGRVHQVSEPGLASSAQSGNMQERSDSEGKRVSAESDMGTAIFSKDKVQQ